ncbi:MAG: hypothetical protein FWE22_01135 [Firmicutes bacterium]|nr:hypothetical protein [Bacillota bacterium]
MLNKIINKRERRNRKVWGYISLMLVVICVLLTIHGLNHDRLQIWTLSRIGLHSRTWFLVFAILLSLAFIINLKLLLTNLTKNNETPFLNAVLFLNMPLALSQAIIIEESVQVLHIYLAAVFTAHSILTMLLFISLIIHYRGKGSLIFVLPIFAPSLAMGTLNIYMLLEVHGVLIAYYQLLLIYGLIFTIFFLQFIENNLPQKIFKNNIFNT